MTASVKPNATSVGSVAPQYVHYDKVIAPQGSLELSDTRLKWYDLASPETPVPNEIHRTACCFLERESTAGHWKDMGELGFVILHRCGSDFYFLLLSTWRNENELWESVYAKDGVNQPDFQPFTFQGLHRGTFCVWELAAVWHEQQAWKRYLATARDDSAQQAYMGDSYRGPA